MVFVHAILLLCLLVVVARLMKLQVIDRRTYYAAAQELHFGDVKLSAQRGEILAMNSRTGETTILATNTTLDLLYVDPKGVDDASQIGEMLSDILLTPETHQACSKGEETCPRELIVFQGSPYKPVYDPLLLARRLASGSILEPLPDSLVVVPSDVAIPDMTEVRRLFARDIERRISEDTVTFVPLKYSATKTQEAAVSALITPGLYVNHEENLIYANPEEVPQATTSLSSLARKLALILETDAAALQHSLRQRPLRYVPIMRRLTPELSLKIKERKLQSLKETNAQRAKAATREQVEGIRDPLRSIALINEHWRYYPDDTIASQVVGFLNTNQVAQYGLERAFDAQLRGREGSITTVSDVQKGQILTADQTIIDPKDGDTVVLTIDPFVQKEVERILQANLEKYSAESGQVIVMDPKTGRIIAMANAPLFERNRYAAVFDREPLMLPPGKEQSIIVEIFHPVTNTLVVKAYIDQVLTAEGRRTLPPDIQNELTAIEGMYELKDLARYYLYVGEFTRRELFPTDIPDVWLKYKNNLGVGAYLNQTIQGTYEPGSVIKPITMASAIDQGEITPNDRYHDIGEVKKDDFVIRNAYKRAYGDVTMTNCLEFSINTCMTSISDKLGKKLFHRMMERFGFGRVTGIELDELPGDVLPWKEWRNSTLATTAFGQGFSATPLQVITAFAAIANDGKLMKPIIIDSIIRDDVVVEKSMPIIIDQVIKESTADTVTAMLVSAVDKGFANLAKVNGYYIAGKTGTSQISRPGGGYESGTGSTVASFMGYAPASNPKFVAIVKFDRPKNNVQGAQAAAPVFQQIAEFLFEYYGIPPER